MAWSIRTAAWSSGMTAEPRDRLTATPPHVRLCPIDTIAEGTARGFVLEMRAGRFHGFVVRQAGEVRGYVDACPHMGLPVARELDAYLSPDSAFIACGWHSALFRVHDGLCVGGPCAGARLRSWPVAVAEGWIVTA